MSSLLRKFFCFLAWLCIQRHNPFVIGVTGSYGKTTLRHLIFDILRQGRQDVSTPEGNYNGEWGFALAVLQVRSGGRSLFAWIHALAGAFGTILRGSYPQTLVLEYGIDHPGEMSIQTRIVEPDLALFTMLAPSHIEGFGTAEAYYHEKSLLLSRQHKNTYAIGNHDDTNQTDFVCNAWYGDSADVCFTHVNHDVDRVDFDLVIGGDLLMNMRKGNVDNTRGIALSLSTHILGDHHIALVGIAATVALIRGVSPDRVMSIVSELDLPRGRGNILSGLKGTQVIDGTYNGGFDPIVAGVRSMIERGAGKQTIALLGDMRELGSLEDERHRELWNLLRDFSIDHIIFVGAASRRVIGPLVPLKDQGRVRFFLDSREAGRYIHHLIADASSPSIVFAKGSQNTIYLEEALKYIILPEEVSKLVRQDEMYMTKKRKFWRTFGTN